MSNDEIEGCEVHGYPDCDCNTGISEPRDSLRWHMYKDGRTFIMYGPQLEVVARAVRGGYSDVTASGYFCRKTCTIVGAKDGPVSYQDFRPSGRLYA